MTDKFDWTKFAMSNGIFCIASACSESVVFPMDCTKTNMQVRNKSLGMAMKDIYTRSGVAGFYKGLKPAVMRHWFYTNMRVSVYRPILEKLSGGKKKEDTSLGLRFLAGATAGGVSQFLANPLDLLKVKYQTGAVNKGLVNVVSEIYGNGGIKAFYKGSIPNVQRAVMVNAGELATYDTTKRFLIGKMGFEDGNSCYVVAGGVSGFCSTLLSCPADVVKSKLMSGHGNMYRGVIDCYVRTIRENGFMAMYRGFIPTWLRLGPWQLIFWTTTENLKKFMGMDTF